MTINEQVQQFLLRHHCPIDANEILENVKRGVPYQKLPCPSGDSYLIQLYHPVILRKEIFLGNVLFNAYLGLTMKHALDNHEKTDAIPLFNDLQSYYFLVHTTVSLDELMEHVYKAWYDGLEDLYFSDPTPEEMDAYAQRGYFGRFSGMFENYFKSNIQPFPLMIIPLAYVKKLERGVRSYLLEKLHSVTWSEGIANFTANFSFFYGQKSGGAGDVQSCPNFLRRLVSEYRVIEPDEMIAAFHLPRESDFNKQEVKDAIHSKLFAKGKQPSYDPEALKTVFQKALDHFAQSIESTQDHLGESEWLCRYHREKGIFLDESPETLLRELTRGVTIAGRTVFDIEEGHEIVDQETCLLCGCYPAKLEGATILSSDSFSKFHNHSINRKANEKRICRNCALYAYLNVKLSGSKGAGIGQIPRQGNIVFHYGDYLDGELDEIIKKFEEKYRSLFRSQTEEKNRENPSEEVPFAFLSELDSEHIEEIQEENLRSMFRGNDNGQALVLPIHFGRQQLIIFVFPGLNDDIQKRLDVNWYSTCQILSWLTSVGGKEGPYYYLSLPRPEQVLENRSILVINDQEYDTDTAIHLHNLYLQVVPELSKSRAKDGFKYQMLMAERVQRDPLGRFSDAIRHWIKEKKFSVRRQDTFFAVYGKIHDILDMEGLYMSEEKKILDEFSNRMFFTLDMLGILTEYPGDLMNRPNAYEKWPRELVGPLKKKGANMRFVLEQWKNRVIRAALASATERRISESERQSYIEQLHKFEAWCWQYEDTIVRHANHLLTSLLARAFVYLYTVRALSDYYLQFHKDHPEMLTKEAVLQRFEEDVEQRYQELEKEGRIDPLLKECSMHHLMKYINYYKKKISNQITNGGEKA
jgi:hypothetical protein